MAPGTPTRQRAATKAAVGALVVMTVAAGVTANLVVFGARSSGSPAADVDWSQRIAAAPAGPTTTLPPVVVTVVEEVPASGRSTLRGGGAYSPPASPTPPASTSATNPTGTSPSATNAPTTATTAGPPPTTAPPTIISTPGTYTLSAGPAGSVIVAFNGTTMSATPLAASGWTAFADDLQGDEIEIDYRSGNQRILWTATVESGVMRAQWRED